MWIYATENSKGSQRNHGSTSHKKIPRCTNGKEWNKTLTLCLSELHHCVRGICDASWSYIYAAAVTSRLWFYILELLSRQDSLIPLFSTLLGGAVLLGALQVWLSPKPAGLEENQTRSEGKVLGVNWENQEMFGLRKPGRGCSLPAFSTAVFFSHLRRYFYNGAVRITACNFFRQQFWEENNSHHL